jgi:hypothetical protein
MCKLVPKKPNTWIEINKCVWKSHYVCGNYTLERVEITLECVFWKIERVLAKIVLKNDTQTCHFHTFKCRIEKKKRMWKSHSVCRNNTLACGNNTLACRNWACLSKNIFKKRHSNVSFSHVCVPIFLVLTFEEKIEKLI